MLAITICLQRSVARLASVNYMGHNYIGHNYVGHNYMPAEECGEAGKRHRVLEPVQE